MLPSGNDAGHLLAEYFGGLLKEKGDIKKGKSDSTFNGPVTYFLKEMNKNAKRIGLSSTRFDSPHGLANPMNYSSAMDIAVLSSRAMKIPEFR